jgi:hypothetical protein
MKCLLIATVALVPLLGTAQSSYQSYRRFEEAPQVMLYKPASAYQCLDDTLTARPIRLDSGQVTTITALVNGHWWVLNQFINHNSVDFYVRQSELVVILYQRPSAPTERRHIWGRW